MTLKPPVDDDLLERLAERTHENWAQARRHQGWTYGAERSDGRKEHPSLVPYSSLSDDEKRIDREVTGGVLMALNDLGFQVTPAGFDTFREYEFIAQSTQFLTERRQSAAHTYLTVNTAIFAILGVLIEKVGLTGWKLGLASLPLLVAGAISCLVWRKALQHYRSLIDFRYRQLMAIETTPAMSGSHGLYTREWNEYDSARSGQGFPFSKLEALLPILFLGLYAVYLIVLLVVIVRWVM
jgi:hypothetical protein